jgi:hypothetical protein
MEHNVISLNGGTLTNQPYVISNNLMYVNFSGNVIATCPAANVTVCSNRLLNTGSYNYIAFVIGQSGAQAGSPDACNTNIVIYGNYVSNSAKALWLNGGSGYDDPARIDGVKFYNNTLVGQQWLTIVWTQNWVTNCNVYSNDLSGQSGGVKFETDNILASYSDVSTNNNYWGTIILNGEWGPTNAISYGGGSRYRMTYPYSASVPNYLVTADAGHIPSDAAIVITNAAYSGASVPVYFDQTMTSSVTLTNTQVTTFYWNGSTWTTNPTSRPSPPTDLQVGLGLP